jgi:hypothetical protein
MVLIQRNLFAEIAWVVQIHPYRKLKRNLPDGEKRLKMETAMRLWEIF